jgi:hypothetical protein
MLYKSAKMDKRNRIGWIGASYYVKRVLYKIAVYVLAINYTCFHRMISACGRNIHREKIINIFEVLLEACGKVGIIYTYHRGDKQDATLQKCYLDLLKFNLIKDFSSLILYSKFYAFWISVVLTLHFSSSFGWNQVINNISCQKVAS